MRIKWVNMGEVLRTKPGTQVSVKQFYEESYKIKALIMPPLPDKRQGRCALSAKSPLFRKVAPITRCQQMCGRHMGTKSWTKRETNHLFHDCAHVSPTHLDLLKLCREGDNGIQGVVNMSLR